MVFVANTPLAKAVQSAVKRDEHSIHLNKRTGGLGEDPKVRWEKVVEAIETLERRVDALERGNSPRGHSARS